MLNSYEELHVLGQFPSSEPIILQVCLTSTHRLKECEQFLQHYIAMTFHMLWAMEFGLLNYQQSEKKDGK